LRLINDYAPSEAPLYLTKAEQAFPDWYLSYSKMDVGTEQNLKSPVDSFQLFMAKAFLQQDQWKNGNGDKLAHFVDTSWLDAGDFFYMHKLSETIKTYRGWTWNDEGTITPPPTTPTPTSSPSTPGDTDGDGDVDLSDLTTLLTNFGKSGTALSGDTNGDGDVDLSDLTTLLSNFGR
ncbi:hypothetical protein HY468_01895, partial [Candidatus Roizmanbacteria bacterium]|nr:hypothetical protein [Candidatus Roizmanbacteria bacterium]